VYNKVSSLSGGWLKRLSIARQVAREPDLLLLDEPTNHLDMEGIEWLEKFLRQEKLTYILISHDRQFIQNATTSILEINHRFKETYWRYECDYHTYIQKKEEFFETELQRASNLSNKARNEDAWMKAGVKARGTKQEARKKNAYELFDEVKDIKNRTRADKKVDLSFESTEKKTKRLVVLHNIHKNYDEKKIIEGLDLTLTPGMRIGLIGPNGVGKSTLMDIISADLNPDVGKRNLAEGAKIIKFDQKRQLLDKDVSLREALTPAGSDYIDYRGERLHVASWAAKLKFRSDQLTSAVHRLSGGEQARVLLGQLMLQPADILLLDEPTNDLDIPSIELLEESLMTFPGAVVLVTHDRQMLERVSTQMLAFLGGGKIKPIQTLDQWHDVQKPEKEDITTPQKTTVSKEINTVKPKKFSYKEQQEWDRMEEKILHAEIELETLGQNAVDANMSDEFQAYCKELEDAQHKVEKLYARWEELNLMHAEFNT
jgi:ATP-binding cassette subfamily F protein uup